MNDVKEKMSNAVNESFSCGVNSAVDGICNKTEYAEESSSGALCVREKESAADVSRPCRGITIGKGEIMEDQGGPKTMRWKTRKKTHV